MFSKKTESATRPFAGSGMSGTTFSVLGADVAIKGNLSAKAELHIDGRIDGDIACAALVQGESSEINGAIVAETARLAGRVRGSITVGQLVILKSARIEGDVFYDAVTIEQGAHVDGKFAHREPETKLALAGGTLVS
jgi:cytoskeletal protein CcmA (bactofilin family)